MAKYILMKMVLPLVLVLVNTCPANSQNIDINILRSVNPDNPNSSILKATSQSSYYLAGGVVGGTLAYGLLNHDKKIQRNGYELLISLGLSAAITESLKRTINRTRPADRYPGEVIAIKPDHGRSFPSGHTTIAFATATTLTLQYKKWWIAVPAFAWAGTTGYSRMYLGLHYPSDVLGGAAIGVGSAFVSHWLTQKLLSGRPK